MSIVARIFPKTASVSIVATCSNNDVVHIFATVFSNNDLGSCGCLVPRKKRDRQTDMEGPVSCSSLTLEREEHQM
jgi:hypothetical protein